jgi:hypothetical protein
MQEHRQVREAQMTTQLPQVTRTYQNHVLDSTHWQHYQPRTDDMIVSTSYKSGTTWTQEIVRQLLFCGQDVPERDAIGLGQLSPWIERRRAPLDEMLASLDAQQHRRSLKTHLALDGLRFFPQVKYIVVGRDARELACPYGITIAVKKTRPLVRPTILWSTCRPHGIVHTFWNASDKPLRFIDIYPNQNFEDFFPDGPRPRKSSDSVTGDGGNRTRLIFPCLMRFRQNQRRLAGVTLLYYRFENQSAFAESADHGPLCR